MIVNINAAVRSLRYWCSQSAHTTAVFPMTAYNALLHPAQWEDNSIVQSTMARHAVNRGAFKDIAVGVVEWWAGPVASINLHAVAWALTHMTADQQIKLAIQFTNSLKGPDMKDTPHSVPPDVMSRLTTNLAALEAALLSKDPMMPNHLRESHRILISYPETVHLLDDTEIARLIEGAVVYTKTEIVKATAAKKKAASKVTIDDL